MILQPVEVEEHAAGAQDHDEGDDGCQLRRGVGGGRGRVITSYSIHYTKLYEANVDGRRFETLDGRRVTLSETDRVEMVEKLDP